MTMAAARPVAVFVLGAQRSGTSAITRVLSLCGGALPSALLGADLANPAGFWEPRKAVDLNEAILYRLGSNWADPILRLPDDGPLSAQNTASVSQIDAFLSKLPAASLLIIKEPRITVLSGVWFEAARRAELDIAAVIAVRHPHEVAASLATHGRTSPELASALWLKYCLLAERCTRGLPRVFVDYANLLDDWRRETTRISRALPIDLSAPNEAAVEEFLKPNLRRQRYFGPVTDLFGTDWLSAVYQALGAAARDEPFDTSALDSIFEAYQSGAQDFRKVFKDFDDHFNRTLVRTLFPPFISRRVRAASVLATRLGIAPHRLRHYGQFPAGNSREHQSDPLPQGV
ncbi:sulfotransferase family protein [Mycobacterium nebraskense]|uniref:sulfotransferase family protein n=1 Tax=Mycobacterium nebraskense TaxID=244292 RepID=UPI001E63FA28|nr:sulfotransferase family protein [Mycobacterium nebraskense]